VTTGGDDRWAGFASWSIPAGSDAPDRNERRPADERPGEVENVASEPGGPVVQASVGGDEPGPVGALYDEVGSPADSAVVPADGNEPGPVGRVYDEVASEGGSEPDRRAGWASDAGDGWERGEAVAEPAGGRDSGALPGVAGRGPMAVAAERLVGSGGDAVAGVAAAVAALDELERLPVGEHVRWYDALHGELSDALASIDEV
jgi:hypothetical protein